jgi:hypothetical protein
MFCLKKIFEIFVPQNNIPQNYQKIFNLKEIEEIEELEKINYALKKYSLNKRDEWLLNRAKFFLKTDYKTQSIKCVDFYEVIKIAKKWVSKTISMVRNNSDFTIRYLCNTKGFNILIEENGKSTFYVYNEKLDELDIFIIKNFDFIDLDELKNKLKDYLYEDKKEKYKIIIRMYNTEDSNCYSKLKKVLKEWRRDIGTVTEFSIEETYAFVFLELTNLINYNFGIAKIKIVTLYKLENNENEIAEIFYFE